MAAKPTLSATCLGALLVGYSAAAAFSPSEPLSFGRISSRKQHGIPSSIRPADARAFAGRRSRPSTTPLHSSTYSEDLHFLTSPIQGAGYHVIHPDKRTPAAAAAAAAGFHATHPSDAGASLHVGQQQHYTGYHKSSLSATAATLSMPMPMPSLDRTLDVDEYITIPEGVAEESGKIMEVVSAALLITGNTVGAGMMALPDVAAGPGMAMSTALFSGIFCVNLISGLLIAEVAIKQHESSGGDVSSSFKEFADVTLKSSTVANMISSISIFVNWCVLSFALMEAGGIASSTLSPQGGLGGHLDPTVCAAGVAAVLTGLVGTQTNRSLSNFASGAVAVLFASFGMLLIPGLGNVVDPVGTFLAPGTFGDTGGNMMGALTSAAPIFITTLVYQNIVPSVTKLLGYDRTRTTAAIVFGSLMPLIIYEAFCFTVLGGGLEGGSASTGPLLTAFAASSLAGSSVAGVMSIAEEFDNTLFKKQDQQRDEDDKMSITETQQQQRETPSESKGDVASIPSVLLAILPPLAAGAVFAGGEDFTAALSCAGSYGSPLLYGFLPVAMAWTQRKQGDDRDERTVQDGYDGTNILGSGGKKNLANLVPGGAASLSLLGVASAGYMLQEVATDMTGMLSSVGMA